MISHCNSTLSGVTDLLSKSCLYTEKKSSPNKMEMENPEILDNVCDLDELEEVFVDHLIMSKRIRKTLYAGDFNGFTDLPDHPPIALTGLALELFSKAVPNYGLDILDMDYVSTASKAAHISPCAMILALIYLDRLQRNNSEYLETVSPSGLFVVTMLVASKFLFENDEDIVTNQMWAEALNFDVKDLNELEYEFLSAIDWKVFVDYSEYFFYLCSIEKVVAVRQSSLRDWLSYTDICVLIQDPAFQNFWTSCVRQIAKATVLWAVGYITTALALYGSGITMHRLTKSVKDLSTDYKVSELQSQIAISFRSLHIPSQHLFDDAQFEEKLHSDTVTSTHLSGNNEQHHISYGLQEIVPCVCRSFSFRKKSDILSCRQELTKAPLSSNLRSYPISDFHNYSINNHLIFTNHNLTHTPQMTMYRSC
ncbi:Protein CNPPD1, partial [Stegodyphus mimosarum]